MIYNKFNFQTYDRDGDSKVSFTFKVKQKDSEIYIPYEFDDRFEINTLTGEFKLNENHQIPIGKSLLGKYEIEVEVNLLLYNCFLKLQFCKLQQKLN